MKGIGIDIEEISRFKLKKSDRFVMNNFTDAEIEYAYSKASPQTHLCGFFCAKEALLKTLKKGNYLLNEIEITHKKNGKPKIKILKNNNYKFILSISHAADYGCAVVSRT